MHKKFDMQEERLKIQVNKAYEEYKDFIKVSEMPKYKFNYISQKGSTIAEERYENDMYHLIVANTLGTTNYKAAAKGILFHEFTHIWDEENLTQIYGFSHEDRNTPYVYKEIHAEQIKTLYLLGCKTIDDIENIDKDRIRFQYQKSMYNIYDYLIEYQKELRDNIELIKSAEQKNTKINVREFNNILNRIFYYVGTASIYLKYCDANAYEELDIREVWEYYGYGTNMLFKEVVKNPIGYHTRELIEAMSKVRLLIVQHFCKIIDDTL